MGEVRGRHEAALVCDIGNCLPLLCRVGKGGYDAAPHDKASSIVVDFITPETETSIWYFWGMTRNFNPHDKALTASICEGQGKIFREDLEMLERQQKNLLAYPDRSFLKLNIDAVLV